MKTRDRILDAAHKLFNEQGTAAVSTNHIAEAAGISPGNLYYHFRNKEEIIRALFERLFDLWDSPSSTPAPSDWKPTLDDVKGIVQSYFEIMWQYRFVYREILPLIWQDTILHERYITVRKRGYEGFFETFALLGTSADQQTAKRLADLVWLISEFWLPTVEVRGETISPEQMQEGIDLMMQVLKPYIRE